MDLSRLKLNLNYLKGLVDGLLVAAGHTPEVERVRVLCGQAMGAIQDEVLKADQGLIRISGPQLH